MDDSRESGDRTPPPFWGPQNSIKWRNRVCAQIVDILVIYYVGSPPPYPCSIVLKIGGEGGHFEQT